MASRRVHIYGICVGLLLGLLLDQLLLVKLLRLHLLLKRSDLVHKEITNLRFTSVSASLRLLRSHQ